MIDDHSVNRAANDRAPSFSGEIESPQGFDRPAPECLSVRWNVLQALKVLEEASDLLLNLSPFPQRLQPGATKTTHPERPDRRVRLFFFAQGS